jgi:hypothetical protein
VVYRGCNSPDGISFFLMFKREEKREETSNLPSSNGEDTGLSILLYGFKSRWEESRLVTVCGCEAAGIPAKVCRLGY